MLKFFKTKSSTETQIDSEPMLASALQVRGVYEDAYGNSYQVLSATDSEASLRVLCSPLYSENVYFVFRSIDNMWVDKNNSAIWLVRLSHVC